MHFKKHIVNLFTGALVLVWVFSSAAAQAQTTYPVQVNAHLLPPYSLYLSDYYSGTREKLTVTLINRDQFTPSLTVRLRMTITAQGGVRMQTNDNAFFQPIIVESGLPVRLTLEDLAPYFQPANLIAQGAVAGGKLPEGMIEFCFQVFEAYTSQPLSQPNCARAWITSQKPPLLSLPGNNESIAFRDPLNLMFQWTPRHHGLTYVEYDFILKELWDNGMAPQAAFAYAPEIYRETVRGTSLIYGALHPPLLPGKRYAWAVRAQAREGVDAVNLFQNEGQSEIRWFTLQDNCDPLQFVVAEPDKKRLNVRWNRLPEHIGYTVSYRLVDNTSSELRNAEWSEVETQESQAIVSGLKNGGTYEYRVGSFCAPGQAVYSPIFVTTLPETDSTRLAQCGIMPAINLANQSPIGELKTGEVIMASDYSVTITRLSGGQGVYSGEGWTIIPWLNDAKIAVQFSNITVNTDRQMIVGYIDAQYDRGEGQIANVDDLTEGGFDVGTVKNGITKVDYKFDFSIPGVDAFSLNEDGELVIQDREGVPHTVSSESREGQGNEGNKVVVFPMTVEDKNGNVYQVEKVVEKGASGAEREVAKATFIGKSGAPLTQDNFDPSQLNGDRAIVTFNNEGGYYALDTWKDYYGNVALIKPKYEKLFTNYYVPWKLLPPGKKDVVGAKIAIKDSSIDPRKVIFKTPEGIQFQAEYNDDTKAYTIQLAGGEAGDAQDVFALYPTSENKYWNLGKLSVASYAEQTFTVVLVPVNNVLIEEAVIEQRLKEIYGPVGIRWEIVKAGNFLYDETKAQLMANSTGIRTYTEAMRALNNHYQTEREFNSKANYLFFLKATGAAIKNNRDAVAFMPRGGQFGYIFTSEIRDENEPTTVAHELGHGRFKLFHTFDEHYGGFERGQTDNLMDYRDGTYLAKWQWDVMSDPAYVVNVFEKDEKSQIQSDPIKDYWKILAQNIYNQTGKNVYGVLYCKECGNTSTSLNTKIIREGVHQIDVRNKRCFLSTFLYDGSTFKVEDPNDVWPKNLYVDTDKAAVFELETQGKYVEGQALVALFGDKPSGYCSEYIDKSLADICVDSFSPDNTFLNSIYHSITQCLIAHGIFKADDSGVRPPASVLQTPLVTNEAIRVLIRKADGTVEQHQSSAVSGGYEPQYIVTIDEASNATVKLSENFLNSLGDRVPPAMWEELGLVIDDLFRQAAVNLCDKGSGPDCLSTQLNFLQVINLNLQSLATNNTIEPSMWNDGGIRNILPAYARWEAPGGGLVDGLVEEAVGIPILIKTVGEIALSKEKQQQIGKVFTRDGMEKLGKSILADIYSSLSDPEKRSYTLTKTSVSVVFLFYSFTSQASKKLDDVLRKAEDLAGKIENAPNLRTHLGELTQIKDIARMDRLSKLIDELGPENVDQILARVEASKIDDLFEDLSGSGSVLLRSAIRGNVELVESWKGIADAAKRANPDMANAGRVLRKDIKSLEALARFNTDIIARIGSRRLDDFMTSLIKANPKCKTCGNLGSPLIGDLDDVLNDLHKVVTERVVRADGSLVDGFDDFMKEAGEQASKAQAAVLTLKKMSRNWDDQLTAGGWELDRFEGSIPDIETGHKLDVLFKRKNVTTEVSEFKSVEMKNWSLARSVSGSTFDQFKAYIASRNGFEYYFSDGLSDAMKNNFQNVFKDASKAQELWTANPSFFTGLSADITKVDDVIDLANSGDLIDLIDFVK